MEKPIVRDVVFLGQKSADATAADVDTAEDLLDTLKANADRCVGLAANMIGVKKRIIAFDNDGEYCIMFNPEIIRKDNAFDTEEGCLSLDGIRKTKRYKTVKIKYQNKKMQQRFKTFSGFTAQIIQHEIDHCNGIII